MEKEFIKSHDKFIAATDEVGRGPLAGPVVGGCAFVSGDLSKIDDLVAYLREHKVTDSKKLTDKKREKILEALEIDISKGSQWRLAVCGFNVDLAVSERTPKQIDSENILQAALKSMKNAFLTLNSESLVEGSILIDGNKAFEIEGPQVYTVIKGDSKSALIGLASIVAKVYRDKKMADYAKKYPHYDFEKNAGYPTQKHRMAIEEFGITPIHRKSFKGVREFVQS